MSGANGLRFHDFGVVYTEKAIPPSTGTGRSLEMWMQPANAKDSSTILAFYDHGAHRRLSFRQSDSDLKITVTSTSVWRGPKSSSLYLSDVFQGRKSDFWTLTTGSSGTSIYRDGVLVSASRDWQISREEFSGRLVFGTAPIFNDAWEGTLRGLAIYDNSLTADQVLRHYKTWTIGSMPEIEPAESCAALYLFDERTGRIIQNRVSRSTDLIIPTRYLILNQSVLDPIWRAFNWSKGFWKDAIINVGGFIPPCFFFCAYLSAKRFPRPALVASLVGSGISLLIELLQSQLPTRDSSMSDLVTNVIGSVIGAALYRGTLASLFNRSLNMTAQILAGR